jgi:RES domain-containing protein
VNSCGKCAYYRRKWPNEQFKHLKTALGYQNQIFSGLGGLYADGRWTFRGHPVIYTSASISLAVLEYTLNYRRRGWVPASVLGRAVIPDKMRIEVVTPTDLPRNWSAVDSPSQLRETGQRWLDAGAAAVLKVPSAVVVEEWNYVLNPQHPDFKKLIFQKPKRFQFDRRLAQERKS